MSRIRSIHPSLWTDEAFVSLSPFARLLVMGIWNECDDAGSFAWSPLTLKMRILPADNADANELLAELTAARIVLRYEVDGKPYGAVRNFCKFQRPKKPNSVHPQTDEVRQWVGTEARSIRDGGEAVGNRSGTPSENPRQMEEGGGNSVSDDTGPVPDPLKEMFDLGVALLVEAGSNERQARSQLGKWRKAKGEANVLQGIIECRARSISNPIEWLEKRFVGAQYVSASGHEYRGDIDAVIREAEKRADWSTYWKAKGDRDGRAASSDERRTATAGGRG